MENFRTNIITLIIFDLIISLFFWANTRSCQLELTYEYMMRNAMGAREGIPRRTNEYEK
jgi:hypothetical protein